MFKNTHYCIFCLFLIYLCVVNGQVKTKGLTLNSGFVLGVSIGANDNYLYVSSDYMNNHRIYQFQIADIFNDNVTILTPTSNFNYPLPIGYNDYALKFQIFQDSVFFLTLQNFIKATTNGANQFSVFGYTFPANTPPNFQVLSNGNAIVAQFDSINLVLVLINTNTMAYINQLSLTQGITPSITSSLVIDETTKRGYVFLSDKVIKFTYTNTAMVLDGNITLPNPLYSVTLTESDVYTCVADGSSFNVTASTIPNLGQGPSIYQSNVINGTATLTDFPRSVYDSKLDQILSLYTVNDGTVSSYSLSNTIDSINLAFSTKPVVNSLPSPLPSNQIAIARNPAKPSQQAIIYATVGNQVVIVPYESFCSSNCNQNGICQNLVCQCDEGFYGTSCEYENPTITSISEKIYKSSSGITIIGTNFINPIVTIDNMECTIYSNSETNIFFMVPDSLVYNDNNNYTLTLNINGGLVNFTNYISFLMPSIDSFEQNGKNFSIYGQYFLDTIYQITIGGSHLLYHWISADEISVIIPQDVSSFTLGVACSVCPTYAPLVINLTPLIDNVSRDSILYVPTSVTFDIWFYNSSGITINQGPNKSFQVTPNQQNQFVITTILDSVEVSANRYFQVSTEFASSIKYEYNYVTPLITSATQLSSTNIIIETIGFGSNEDDLFIYFNGNEEFVGEITDIQVNGLNSNITVLLPLGLITGTFSIDIQNYTFSENIELQPTIESISPIPSISGGYVTIIGSHILNNFTKGIAGLECEEINQHIEYECIIPEGTGKYSIKVVSKDQEDLFDYQYQSPVVSTISPNNIELSTNTTLTITGDQFSDVNLQVDVGGIECLVIPESLNITYLICNWTSPSSKPEITLLEVSVTVDGLTGKNSLLQLSIDCPVDANNQVCGNQGTCLRDNGICQCNEGLSGDICNITTPSEEISVAHNISSKYSLFIFVFVFILIQIINH